MKRTSRDRTRNVRYVVGVVCGIVFLVVAVSLRSAVAGVLWRIWVPVLAHDPVGALTSQLTSKTALVDENAVLRAQLASTTAALADRNLLYRENLTLKSLMNRDASTRSVLAGVIMRPPDVPYDTLMLDAGKVQGIAVGDYVSAGGTTIIGSVDAVYPTTARVVLFSAPTEVYQALLTETAAHAAVPLTVEGQGGGSMIAQVPAHTVVTEGDAVVFPGIADGLTAFVSQVDSEEGSSFETLYLRLPTNPLQLRFVEVLTR